jgi:aryl-alcohol dehydrogenase-like predicted oxidoreductase
MQTIAFPPLDREVGRLVLGTTWFDPSEQAAAADVLDAFADLGGTILDTAENYGGGKSELTIGRWLRDTGRRDRTVILSKGAHPYEGRSRVDPASIDQDLIGSLERLDVETIDIYLLHRDDEGVAVGPILDALNAHRAEGRIRTFGASNWSPARLDEAAAYAADHGLEGFTSSSVQFALAEPAEPPWPLCISGRDEASRAWYARTQFPLFAWSSQAGGFFAAMDEGPPDAELERVYGTESNRARRRRAAELAGRLGVSAPEVALAWAAAQPFPIFPIVRTRRPAHLGECAAALDLALDPETLAWLDRG